MYCTICKLRIPKMDKLIHSTSCCDKNYPPVTREFCVRRVARIYKVKSEDLEFFNNETLYRLADGFNIKTSKIHLQIRSTDELVKLHNLFGHKLYLPVFVLADRTIDQKLDHCKLGETMSEERFVDYLFQLLDINLNKEDNEENVTKYLYPLFVSSKVLPKTICTWFLTRTNVYYVALLFESLTNKGLNAKELILNTAMSEDNRNKVLQALGI